VLSGANVHDVKLLEQTLDSKLIGAPDGAIPNLCCDKGYDSGAARKLIEEKGYAPHVVSRGEEQKMIEEEGKKARRWVVERALFDKWNNALYPTKTFMPLKQENALYNYAAA
jgi:transposase